jgi:MoaA/NifB/PqqE/SkfB family radical SAM enzyme
MILKRPKRSLKRSWPADKLAGRGTRSVRRSSDVLTAEEGLRLGRELRGAGRYDAAAEEFQAVLSHLTAEQNPYLHNTVLNELEITRGATVLQSKPRAMSVVLSNKCNIECIMCSVWNNEWELPETRLREIVSLAPFMNRVMWQGGEVLMHKSFPDVFDELSRHPHLEQHIITNGLLFSENWAKRLVRSNVNLIISVDGVTSRTYEHIRKKGRFDKLLEGLKRLNDARDEAEREGHRALPLAMNVVVMRSNLGELDNFVDFAHAHRFDTLQITPVDAAGAAPDVQTAEDIFRTPDRDALSRIAAALPRMRARAETLGIKFHVWLPPLEQSEMIREPDRKQNGESAKTNSLGAPSFPNELSCHWPWQLMHIDRERVRPHCFCGNDIGNLHESGILELWNNEAMQTYRRRLYANTAAGWCSNRCVAGQMSPEALKLDA